MVPVVVYRQLDRMESPLIAMHVLTVKNFLSVKIVLRSRAT